MGVQNIVFGHCHHPLYLFLLLQICRVKSKRVELLSLALCGFIASYVDYYKGCVKA